MDLASVTAPCSRAGSLFALSTLAALLAGAIASTAAWAQSPPLPSRIEVVPSIAHAFSADSFEFSPDGQRIISSSGGTPKLWDVASGRLLRTFSGLGEAASRVAFLADGKRVLSGGSRELGGRRETLKIWDSATGRLLKTVSRDADLSDAIAVSGDGTRAAAGAGHAVKVWDLESGRPLATLGGHSDSVDVIAVARDGSRILSGSSDKTARLWDATTGRTVHTFRGHTFPVTAIAISADGRQSLSGSIDKTVKLWDNATGRLIRTFSGHTDRVDSVSFFPGGKRLMSASMDRTIRIWDLDSGRTVRILQGSDDGRARMSPSGAHILSPHSVLEPIANGRRELSRGLKLLDADTGAVVRIIHGRTAPIGAATSFANGTRLLVGSEDRALRIWDVGTGQLVSAFEAHTDNVSAVAVSTDGSRILSGSHDSAIKLWETGTGRQLRRLGGEFWVNAVAFSPDGARIAAALDFNTTIRLWEAHSDRPIRTLAAASSYTSRWASFSPSGTQVMAGGGLDAIVRLWDASSGRLATTVKGTVAAFSRDGTQIVAADAESIRIIASANGQLQRSFPAANGEIKGLTLSPDGTVVLTAADKTVKLWELATGRQLRTFEEHQGPVVSAGFLADGRHIFSGGQDGAVRIWNVESGDLLLTLVGASDNEWLALTPEGFFAASGKGADILNVVRGFEVWSVDQFYQSLYRPDLVREKLAGDRFGLVREAAARLDLEKVIASGPAPGVTLAAPRDGAQITAEQTTAEVEITDRSGGIGRVEWRLNGVTVGIDQSPGVPVAGQPVRLTRRLSLDEGENEIEVVAYNGRNLVASVPARVAVKAQVAGARKPGRLHVLAIGLNDYADASLKLSYAVPDAHALAKALTHGARGVYENVAVTLLEDADVRRDRIAATFAELAAKIQPDDTFVFFLAGHGKTVDGRYYFIPQNFNASAARTLLSKGTPGVEMRSLIDRGLVREKAATEVTLWREVTTQGLSQDEWQAWLARIPARRSLLLLDTCESGTLAGDARETQMLERGAANDRLARATGRTVLTASSADQDAAEGFRGHGLFTYNVLEALGRADTDGNGQVDVAELATYVHVQVSALSEQVYKRRQVPQVRIVGNYGLIRPVPTLADQPPGIAFQDKATHQLAAGSELLVQPALGARRLRRVDARTPVALVKSENGWTLVARGGRPLGYVATKDLAPLP
jgi:WD40 repeat protein